MSALVRPITATRMKPPRLAFATPVDRSWPSRGSTTRSRSPSIKVRGPRNPLFEIDLGLESQQLTRFYNCRNSQLDVNVILARELNLRLRAKYPQDGAGETVDRRHRALIPDIEGFSDRLGMGHRQQDAFNHVVDIAPCANLCSIAMDFYQLVAQSALDEISQCALPNLPGTIHVERSQHRRRQPLLTVVCDRQMLLGQLAYGVGPASFPDLAHDGRVGFART